MLPYQIVLDTNVLYTALQSTQGASYRLLSLLPSRQFDLHLSVPLVMEYEDVCKRLLEKTQLTTQDIDDILDYIASISKHTFIYYLWRPLLKDPKDDMVLELAITANCQYIVTYNHKDFKGCEQFGIITISPKEFLQLIEGGKNEPY